MDRFSSPEIKRIPEKEVVIYSMELPAQITNGEKVFHAPPPYNDIAITAQQYLKLYWESFDARSNNLPWEDYPFRLLTPTHTFTIYPHEKVGALTAVMLKKPENSPDQHKWYYIHSSLPKRGIWEEIIQRQIPDVIAKILNHRTILIGFSLEPFRVLTDAIRFGRKYPTYEERQKMKMIAHVAMSSRYANRLPEVLNFPGRLIADGLFALVRAAQTPSAEEKTNLK